MLVWGRGEVVCVCVYVWVGGWVGWKLIRSTFDKEIEEMEYCLWGSFRKEMNKGSWGGVEGVAVDAYF